jgi:hypothetical protein
LLDPRAPAIDPPPAILGMRAMVGGAMVGGARVGGGAL